MPIYEYQCLSCGKELEVSQRIVEAPLKDCPNCQKPMLERLISATSFQLKGSGWYKDGYGGGKKSTRSENTVGDRMDKAVTDDKKKSETVTASPSPASGTSGTSGSTSGSTSGGSGDSGTGA